MKNIIYTILSIIIIILVILFFVNSKSSVDGDKNDQKDNIQKLEKIKIGYSALRISLPIFVAKEKEFFKEVGLDVELERYDTAQPLMASLIAGNIDMAGYTALPITYNMMLRSKVDLYFVSGMMEDQNHRISYLIVPKNTKEEFKISDLKGKKVGILPTIAYKAWIKEILKNNDINSDEVELVQIAPSLSPAALESGQVDALFTNDPAATTVLQKGIGRLLSSDVETPKYLGEPFLFGSFNIRKDFADKNTEITKKVISVIDKAIKFINENPKESREMMKKYLHESQREFVDFYPDALYKNSTDLKEEDFEKIAKQYLKIGILKKEIKIKGLIK